MSSGVAERTGQPLAANREQNRPPRSAVRWPCNVVTIESSSKISGDDEATLLQRGIELYQYKNGASALIGIGASNPQIVIAPTDMTDIGVVEFVQAVVDLTGIPVLVGVHASESSHALGFHALGCGARGLIPLPSSAEKISSSIAQLGFLRSDMAAELENGELKINPQSLRATVAGTVVHLAPKEFETLKYLMMEAPRVVSLEEITAHTRDSGTSGSTRIRLAIMRTRKKLTEASPTGNSFIETVRGVGYRMALSPN